MRYPLNKVIKVKKPHACGSNQWIIIGTGVQIKLKCIGCGRIMILLPAKLDRIVKWNV